MNISKVLLLWPYTEQKKISDEKMQYYFNPSRFPLGIGYLTAYLEKNGYEVEVIDLVDGRDSPVDLGDKLRWGLTDEEIIKRIRDSKAQLVGVSQMFSYLDEVCRNIFSLVKEADPSIVTVWGGTHPTVMTEACLKCPNVDYIILGEGERPLAELIRRLNEKQDVKGMKSLGYKEEGDNFIINNERDWIEDLDNHVLPNRVKCDVNKYKWDDKNKKMVNMITSRGCPFNCTFCTAPSFYQRRFRSRSALSVVDEMEFLEKRFGADLIILQDENMTFDMARAEKILDIMIERKIGVKWYAEVGVSVARLNRQIIFKMKQTNMVELRLGIESLDDKIIKNIGKPIKQDKVWQVVQWAHEAKIRVVSFLLMGIPGETVEQIRNTVNMADEIGFDWNVISFVLPLPGTAIYRDLVENKEITVDFTALERYTIPPEVNSGLSSEQLVSLKTEANNRLNFENNYNLTRGDVRQAISDFKNYLIKYPYLEKFWYYLGQAYYKIADIKNTRDAFQSAYDINRNYKNVAEWVKVFNNDRITLTPSGYLPDEIEERLGYSYGHWRSA